MGLLNVRLDTDDSRKARALRKTGLPVSDIVRRAIRAEYARRVEVPRAKLKPSEIVADIIRRHPDSAGRSPVDTSDRHAVRRFIRAKLKRRRG